MTSRNSFFNLLKEDFRRRLWTVILSSLVFFATFVIAFTMLIQNWESNYNNGWYATDADYSKVMSSNICDFLGMYPWFMFVAIVGAIICGVSGFSYLHSKKQMDFYHSLPVKREKIFAVRFVNGILIYAIPYFIGLLYTFLISAVFGVMTTDILYCGLFCFVLHLMGYIIVYLVAIIAMLLTGKMVIAFFGIGVLHLYAPAIYGMALTLRDTFFVTSYSGSVDIVDALRITRWFSPLSYYFSLITAVNEEEPKFWLELLSFLLLAAVLTVLAIWIYKKRPSEKADTAMSFKMTEPVIRVMLAIPIGILAGLLLFSIQYDYGVEGATFWLVFGSVVGTFLAHGIIESLYHGDVKKCLSHKAQMLVTMVVAAVIPLCFFYDIFGYDSYQPEKDKVATMAVVNDAMIFGSTYYNKDGWVSPTEYALEEMEVTEFDAMYELAGFLTEKTCENRRNSFFGNSYAWQYEENEQILNTNFVVKYTLKNGREVLRTYNYNYYALLDLLEQIYNNEEYKTAVHPVFSLEKAGYTPSKVECYSPGSPVTKTITTNIEQLLDVYKSEFLEIDFDELKNSAAIGELTVWFQVGTKNIYTDASTFLVYPSMTRTIAFLKEQGYNMQSIVDVSTVDSISICYYGSVNDLKTALSMEVEEENTVYEEVYPDGAYVEEYYDVHGYPTTAPSGWDYQEIYVEFTDPAEIAEIAKGLIPYKYFSEFGPFPARFTAFNADVYFQIGEPAEGSDVVGWTEKFRFRKDGVPQFVIDRIFEKMGEK